MPSNEEHAEILSTATHIFHNALRGRIEEMGAISSPLKLKAGKGTCLAV